MKMLSHFGARSVNGPATIPLLLVGLVFLTTAHIAHASVVYFAQGDNVIRQVSDNGVVSPYTTVPGFFHAIGLASDRSGNLFVDCSNNGTVVELAANGSQSVVYDGGSIGNRGIAIDGAGNIYVANAITNTVTKVSRDGTNTGYVANLNMPDSVVVDGSGLAYAIDDGDGSINKITAAGLVTKFATNLNNPGALALDPQGNLYVSSVGGNQVLRINSDGSSTAFISNLNAPAPITFDTIGNLYVYDSGDTTLLKVTPTGAITTVANSGLFNIADLTTQLPEPSCISAAFAGLLYVICRRRHRELVSP